METYNQFIQKLKNIFTDAATIKILNKYNNDDDKIKKEKCLLFIKLIDEYDEDSFMNCKIKIFSHKNKNTLAISNCLFGPDLSIKNLLNNQTNEIKIIIWNYMHIIYKTYKEHETIKNESNEVIKTKLYELLGDSKGTINLNDDTTNMINDISDAFNALIDNISNPSELMKNIVKISHKISHKYSKMIKEGNIEIDKILNILISKLPGMEGNTNEFTNNIFSNINKIFEKNNNNELIIIDENFSTANVKLGDTPETNNLLSNMKIGSVLKMADKLGFIPNTFESSNNSTSTNETNLINIANESSFDQMPDIGKLMNIITKITDDNSNINDIKNEMSDFVHKNLGINLDSFTNELEEQFKVESST
uniref:Uncharacterized protein n=1 Tax=viral metagenome TaxID=1070528 RepID=A0A6C0H8D9_9ZZZZ